MPINQPNSNNFSTFDNLAMTDSLGIQPSGRTSDPTDSDLAAGRLYYNSTSQAWKWYNGSVWQTLTAGGGGGTPTWEDIYSIDPTWSMTGAWSLVQGSDTDVFTINKTANGAGDIIDITNAGTGKDLKNGTSWSIAASGGAGILELGSGGTINATDGALTIGKTGTATTFSGTVTIDEAVTATASITITGTADADVLTVTAGDVVLSNGKLAITNDDTDTALAITAAAVTTGSVISVTANGVTSGDVLLLTSSDAGFSGKFIRITDGSDVFTIGDEGATVIAGAGGSTVLTLTAGDAVMSDGSLAITDADNAATLTVTNSTATTASVVALVGAGVFTGSTTTSWMTITTAGLTTGTVLYMAAAALTTGKAIHVVANAATTTAGLLTMSATGLTDGWVGLLTGGGANATASGGVLDIVAGAATVGSALRVTTTGVYTGTTGVVDINAASATTGSIVTVNAAGLTEGNALIISATEATLTSGKYINCFDGAASDFTVAKYGATVIAGNAAGTAALTLTAGDALLTSGHLKLTAGTIMAAPQAIVSANTAISVVTLATSIDTTGGATTHTMADGASGQLKTISCITYGGDAVITPDNLAAGTTITLNAAGDSWTGIFLGTEWVTLALSGTAAVA